MPFDYRTPEMIAHFIEEALQEDIREGDHSALSCIPENAKRQARLIVKDEGILAGVDLACIIFQHFDKQLQVAVYIPDGSSVKKGDIAFEVYGSARSILQTERLVLNCMQRMSGIATYTAMVMDKVKAYPKVKILDTRKTTPNFRIPEKWAVEIGGGTNHRFGLFDMIMLKDNHIDFCGSISAAIERVHTYQKERGLNLPIVIETRSLNEISEVLSCGGVNRIMLDNMSPALMKEAVLLINGAFETEASGGITLDTVADVAASGVDYISLGALTHSAGQIDLSLKAVIL